MTAFALTRRPFIGLSSINRGYAISLTSFGPHLLDRLLSVFRLPFTFSSYNESLEQLFDQANASLADNELTDEAKHRLVATVWPAAEFLVARPLTVREPEVEVWGDGRVGMEWYFGKGRVVNATIDANRRLVFSAIIGQARKGEVAFVDNEWPSALIDAIDEISK